MPDGNSNGNLPISSADRTLLDVSPTVVHSPFYGTNPQQSVIVVQGTTKFQGETFFFAMKRKYPLTPLKEKDAINIFKQRDKLHF